MNIKIILSILILQITAYSCKKDEPKESSTTCNCYERHEALEAVTLNNGLIQVQWVFKYNTTTQPDLCAKETGEWVYSGNAGQYRYKVVCN
jgi:hypothetical protein